MQILTKHIELKTKGTGDLIDITDNIRDVLHASKLKEGSALIFVVGSTAAITTFEYEGGLITDIKELCEKLIPQKKGYKHDETWGDANGFSHLRATLFGPSIVIPFENGELCTGTWQQVVLAEFDNRPRERKVIVQLIGK